MSINYPGLLCLVTTILYLSSTAHAAVKFSIETKKQDPYPFMVTAYSFSRGLHTGGTSEAGTPVFTESNKQITMQPPVIMPLLFSNTRYEIFNPDYVPIIMYSNEYTSIVGFINFGVISQIPIDELFKNNDIFSVKQANETNYHIRYQPLHYSLYMETYMRQMDKNGTDVDYSGPLKKYKNRLDEKLKKVKNENKASLYESYAVQMKEIEKLEILADLGMKKRKEYYQFSSSYWLRSDNIREGLFNIFTREDFTYLRKILDKYVVQYFHGTRAQRKDFVVDYESANKKYVYKVELEPTQVYRDKVSWEARITVDASKYFSDKLPGVKQIYKETLVCNAKKNYWQWGDYRIEHEECIFPE